MSEEINRILKQIKELQKLIITKGMEQFGVSNIERKRKLETLINEHEKRTNRTETYS